MSSHRVSPGEEGDAAGSVSAFGLGALASGVLSRPGDVPPRQKFPPAPHTHRDVQARRQVIANWGAAAVFPLPAWDVFITEVTAA